MYCISSITLVSCLCFTELKGPVGQILQYEKTVQAVEQNKVLVPPTYSRYVAWGFADHSLRIGSYDSDKAAMVCEEVCQHCNWYKQPLRVIFLMCCLFSFVIAISKIGS